MTPSTIRRRLGRLVNGMLRPLGLGLHRRHFVERARRPTYAAGFEHLKHLGFAPRTVVDVGVADGTMSLYQAFPNARHILIEPLEEATPFLADIAKQFPHVEYVVAAAARQSGQVTINVHPDMARSSVFWESDYAPGSVKPRAVRAVTLDQIRRERQLEPPMLLKIDVQGAEVDVLAGAAETLVDTEYVVLETSLYEFFHGAPEVGEVVAFMRSRGFVIYDVLALQYRPLDGALSMLDLGFVKERSAWRRLHRFHPLPNA